MGAIPFILILATKAAPRASLSRSTLPPRPQIHRATLYMSHTAVVLHVLLTQVWPAAQHTPLQQTVPVQQQAVEQAVPVVLLLQQVPVLQQKAPGGSGQHALPVPQQLG